MLNPEPTKTQIVLANTLAGVAVVSVVAIAIPWFLVAFIWNLPSAILDAWDRHDAREHSYYK